MWGFVKWIFGGILSPITSIFTSAMDASVRKKALDVDLAKSTMDTDVEFAQLRVEMLKMYQGWWVTRWIVPCIAYPLILWWTCVIADSIYQFPNWSVARLPDPLMNWAGTIILSFFVVRLSETALNPMRGVIDKVLTAHFDRRFGGREK